MSIVDSNLNLYNDYEGRLRNQRQRALRFDRFFRGRQFSRKEMTLLKQYGLIPLVINIVRPLLSNRRAIITSSKPTWKVVSLQGASATIADATQQFLVGKWNADYLDIQTNLAIKDMLITGFGFMLVDCASFLDNSTFDISIKHIGWRYVFPDPNAKEFDLSDAENIVVKKKIGINRAKVIYQLTDDQAAQAVSDMVGADPNAAEIDVIDRYSKYPIVTSIVVPVEGQHLRNLPTVFYTSNLRSKIEQERQALDVDMRKLEVAGKIEVRRLKDLHIYRAISVGQLPVYEGIMDIRDYPIVCFQDEIGDTFADCQGETEFIEGVQRATNKFYSLIMHNAMLQGNFRVMGPTNAVKDKTLFQKTSALPGAYLPYDPDPNLPNGGKPDVLQPGSIASGFYTLANDLIEKSKFILNTYDPMLGNPQGSPETFSTTASLQDFGSQPIKEIARRVDIQISKLGEVAIQFIQNYAPPREMLEFVDIDGTLTSPQTMDASGDKTKVILNDPQVKEGVIAEIKNNTKLGKYSVKVLTQPNLGSDRMIKASFIMNMLMNKAIPASPSIIGMLLEYMEFPNAKKIIANIQAETSAVAQAEQMQKQLEEMSKSMQLMQNENVKLKEEMELSGFRAELDKRLNDIQSAAKEKETQVEQMLSQGQK